MILGIGYGGSQLVVHGYGGNSFTMKSGAIAEGSNTGVLVASGQTGILTYYYGSPLWILKHEHTINTDNYTFYKSENEIDYYSM